MRADTPFNKNEGKLLSPCIDCKERSVGCHGSCEGYQTYRKSLDELNLNIKKQKAMTNNPTLYKFGVQKLKNKQRGH